MRAHIALLPDVVINQIAAGEVIERPASVVRELVDNSIDAGASQVEVELEGGGARLIRVRDNGCGIPRDELALALSRHATSKLRSLTDLGSLASLGFRGEALPSIGAISHLSVTSRVPEAGATAWSVSMEGSAAVSEPKPAAHDVGTTVEVRDLFFSVPVRRRFLKSERTEYLHAQEWMRRAALARPGVELRLGHNGQRIMHLRPAITADKMTQRVEKICGAAFMRQAVAVDETLNDLRVWGWMAPGSATRNQSDVQYWLVNGRPVRDARLHHAVRLAYEDSLAPGRHPAYVLYLEIAAAAIDINVHPAKTEVRFAEPRQVHDFIFSVLRRALRAGGKTSLLPSAQGNAISRVAEQAADYAISERNSFDSLQEATETIDASALEVLAIFDDGLALCRDANELSLIDLARVLLHIWSIPPVASKPLMFPQTLPVSATTQEFVEGHAALLQSCGLDVEPAGPAAVMLRALPAAISGIDIHAFGNVLQEIAAHVPSTPTELLSLFATAALRDINQQSLQRAASIAKEISTRMNVAQLEDLGLARRLNAASLRALLPGRG
jgi:DNA mismatch repair protein MutL